MNVSLEQLNVITEITRAAETRIAEELGLVVKLCVRESRVGEAEPRELLSVVATALRMDVGAYESKSRQAAYVDLRCLTVAVLGQYFPELSMIAVSALVGLGDHTSVLYMKNRHAARMDTQDAGYMRKHAIVSNSVNEYMAK